MTGKNLKRVIQKLSIIIWNKQCKKLDENERENIFVLTQIDIYKFKLAIPKAKTESNQGRKYIPAQFDDEMAVS